MALWELFLQSHIGGFEQLCSPNVIVPISYVCELSWLNILLPAFFLCPLPTTPRIQTSVFIKNTKSQPLLLPTLLHSPAAASHCKPLPPHPNVALEVLNHPPPPVPRSIVVHCHKKLSTATNLDVASKIASTADEAAPTAAATESPSWRTIIVTMTMKEHLCLLCACCTLSRI
jgi:hypothetical protein